MLYGDYTKPDPPADIIRTAADRRVDVALVWGPLLPRRLGVYRTICFAHNAPTAFEYREGS
jgi:hypothetical protein